MHSYHLICNAHLDPVWLWAWEEGAGEAIATFRTAAELCEKYEAFIFNHNEAVLYEWIQQYEPTLFRRIQRLVAQGRWHIMGGWYLQPDCNMPCGEALIRQIELGRRYFARHFGVRPRTAINFDPFGHSQGLVQVLVKCGYDSYLFGRPGAADLRLPAETFVWRGFDSSRIIARRFPGWYNTPLGKAPEVIRERIAWCEKHGEDCAPILWGVGNHGGGPSRKDLAEITAWLHEVKGMRVRHSTPEAYFEEVRTRKQSLPEHADDLNAWAVGCYTSQVRVKQGYRDLENELFMTEKMATAAAVQGLTEYPRAQLKAAERDMAFVQFHDILPGSSGPQGEEDALRIIGHAREELSRARTAAFFALAQELGGAPEGALAIVAYNPHPYPLQTVIDCELQLPDVSGKRGRYDMAVYHGGQRLAAQVERERTNLNVEWRKRVVFRAELPPSQMTRFDCFCEQRSEGSGRDASQSKCGHVTVAWEHGQVRVNAKSGLLDRYEYSGRAVLRGPVEFVVYEDEDDPWGTRSRRLGGERAGVFSVMSAQEAAAYAGVSGKELTPVRVIEDGAVRCVVEAFLQFRSSRMCVRYVLNREGGEIGMECRVQWSEPHMLLRVEFPTLLRRGEYIGQTVFGIQRLPTNNDEGVAQRWTAIYDGSEDLAVTWCTDSGYGSRCEDGVIGLTILRSPAYSGCGEEGHPIAPQDRYTPRIDIGEREFKIWWQAGGLAERLKAIELDALRHNEPPMVLAFSPAGSGGEERPFVTLDHQGVRISSMRLSRDGAGVLVRLFEARGEGARTTLRLPILGVAHEVTLAPFEVKTLRIERDSGAVAEVPMLEDNVGCQKT